METLYCFFLHWYATCKVIQQILNRIGSCVLLLDIWLLIYFFLKCERTSESLWTVSLPSLSKWHIPSSTDWNIYNCSAWRNLTPPKVEKTIYLRNPSRQPLCHIVSIITTPYITTQKVTGAAHRPNGTTAHWYNRRGGKWTDFLIYLCRLITTWNFQIDLCSHLFTVRGTECRQINQRHSPT